MKHHIHYKGEKLAPELEEELKKEVHEIMQEEMGEIMHDVEIVMKNFDDGKAETIPGGSKSKLNKKINYVAKNYGTFFAGLFSITTGLFEMKEDPALGLFEIGAGFVAMGYGVLNHIPPKYGLNYGFKVNFPDHGYGLGLRKSKKEKEEPVIYST